ncbi:universal stress protein [Bdellovibrio sp. NC01]|uniref:universal stress protein n=1 Tax=Bdellovibrio sp. NC01 TaxID=2220073 RepID=UPI00143D0638|nr:universal stress protein [Bdellovibrio sp. NC01]
MSNAAKNKIILWAIDPDHLNDETPTTLKILREWSQKLECQVQPLSIFTEDKLQSLPLDTDTITANLRDYFPAEFNLPKILVIRSSSRRKMAARFNRYAVDLKASYIFVRARNLSGAFFHLGGFTEALLAQTLVPTVVLNVNAQVKRFDAPIIFPTDFKRSSLIAMKLVIRFVQQSKSPLELFNQIEHHSRSVMNEIKVQRGKTAKRWTRHLRSAGIESSVHFSVDHNSLAEEIIQEASRARAGLIIMPSRPMSLPYSLIGSNVKKVLMLAKCPVMVINRKV